MKQGDFVVGFHSGPDAVSDTMWIPRWWMCRAALCCVILETLTHTVVGGYERADVSSLLRNTVRFIF